MLSQIKQTYLLVQALPGVLRHEAEQGEERPRKGIKAGVVKIRVVKCFLADITNRAVAAARGEKATMAQLLLIGRKEVWGSKRFDVRDLASELSL